MEYSFTGKRILITGGTGFIGSHLVARLAKMGNDVRVLVRASSNTERISCLQNVTIIEGSILDLNSLIKASEGADIVYHLAAKLHLPLDTKNPDLFPVNVDGTENLLKASVKNGVSKFVFISSTAVSFGIEDGSIIDESTPLKPAGLYGESKIQAGALVNEYSRKFGLNTTILMPVVVYGYGEVGNVAKMITHVRNRKFYIIGKGETIRSLVYIDTVIEAMLCVTQSPNSNGETYILTDRDNRSILEMVRFISTHFNTSIPKPFIPIPVAYIIGLSLELLGKCINKKVPLTRDIVKRLTTNQICSSQYIQDTLGFAPRTFQEGMSDYLAKLKDDSGKTTACQIKP